MMTFRSTVRNILKDKPNGLTPQEIRDIVKVDYSNFYATESHRKNVEKGHYKDLDHALLAHIYILSGNDNNIEVDRSQKPLKLTLLNNEDEVFSDVEELGNEDLKKLEDNFGTIYVLKTGMFTPEGREIVKIGKTTGNVQDRICQLYTTGVPLKFTVHETYETQNFNEAERALHKLLAPYRVNESREFFDEECLEFIDKIMDLHKTIQEQT